MNDAEPTTLGQRLDRQARAVLARRGEPARRVAARERPGRSWDPPGERRLRVEAEVPPAWDDEPPGYEWAEPTAPAATAVLPFPAELREQLRPLVGAGLDRVLLHDGDHDPAADAVTRQHDAAAITVGQQIFLRHGRFRPATARGRGLLAHEAVHAALDGRPGTGWQRATAAGRAEEERVAHAVGAAVAAAEPTDGRRVLAGPAGPAAAAVIATGPAAAAGLGPRRALPFGAAAVGPPALVAGTRLLVGTAGAAAGPALGRLGAGDGLAAHPHPLAAAVDRRVGGARSGGGRPGPAGPRGGGPGGSGPAGPVGPAGPAGSGSTAAAATPMAAPVGEIHDPAPAAASAGPDLGATREAVLRELMRQLRTDRERGA